MYKKCLYILTGSFVIIISALPSWAAEEKSSGGLPQLDPSHFPSQIFWLIVIFSALYFIFSKKTLPDISSTLENRKNLIKSDLELAEKFTAEAEETQRAYEAELQKAREEAAKIILSTDSEVKQNTNTQLEAFQRRSEIEIKRSEERIENAKLQALNSMGDVAAEVASQAVTKIIGTNTDIKKAQEIVSSLQVRQKAA